jgi:hypothetical protein
MPHGNMAKLIQVYHYFQPILLVPGCNRFTLLQAWSSRSNIMMGIGREVIFW